MENSLHENLYNMVNSIVFCSKEASASVVLDMVFSLTLIASNCLKLNFKLFFLTDVSNYCEERKIKLSVNVYIKIARNLGSNF